MPKVFLGDRGERLIKDYERLRLTAYKPTPNDVWTIGYGSTRGVYAGLRITKPEAEARFINDTRDAVTAVQSLSDRSRISLTQSMIDALISLVFNTGPSSIAATSTIGKAIMRDGNYYAAWRGFCLWTKQKGVDLEGLAKRRTREMMLFLEDGVPD